MIAPAGTRIGVRHTTGEWIPAVVVCEHWTGATIVETVPDPLYVERSAENGHQVHGCRMAIPLVAGDRQSKDYWQHANSCIFGRKCEPCKGFGSTLVEVRSFATVLTGEREVQEVTCELCDGKGWQVYDPWECGECSSATPASDDARAATPAAAYGHSAV